MSRFCSNCEYTTGLMLMSYPPKVKCTLDNKYHFYTDECTVEFAPVKHGQWVHSSPMTDTLECSLCGYNILDEDFETPYCPWCGAKMDNFVKCEDCIYVERLSSRGLSCGLNSKMVNNNGHCLQGEKV